VTVIEDDVVVFFSGVSCESWQGALGVTGGEIGPLKVADLPLGVTGEIGSLSRAIVGVCMVSSETGEETGGTFIEVDVAGGRFAWRCWRGEVINKFWEVRGSDSVDVPGRPNRRTEASISCGLSIFRSCSIAAALAALDPVIVASPLSVGRDKKAGRVDVDDRWGLGIMKALFSRCSLVGGGSSTGIEFVVQPVTTDARSSSSFEDEKDDSVVLDNRLLPRSGDAPSGDSPSIAMPTPDDPLLPLRSVPFVPVVPLELAWEMILE